MAAKPKGAEERVARCLCRLDGNPENITMDGLPMWASYREEAQSVLTAANTSVLVDALMQVASDETIAAATRATAQQAVAVFEGKAPAGAARRRI